MKKKIPIDDKNYSVIGINGFRRGSMTRKEAFDLARKMQKQMNDFGWRGDVKVFYRDGSAVDWKNEKE